MIGIYKITEKENPKMFYVGKSNDIERRFKEHKTKTYEQSRIPFDGYIKEKGIDAFTYEILEECSIEELSEREKYWVDKLNAKASGNKFEGGLRDVVGSHNPNAKLTEDLAKVSKVLGGIQNNQIGNNEIKKLKDEITYLKYQLNNKDNEINELKRKIKNEKPKFDFDDVMWIYFQPIDNSFKEGIKCLKTNTFAEVEEKLYKKYNTLRNTNNNFTANATPVLRFKTIEENKIKDHDIIILYKKE